MTLRGESFRDRPRRKSLGCEDKIRSARRGRTTILTLKEVIDPMGASGAAIHLLRVTVEGEQWENQYEETENKDDSHANLRLGGGA